MQESGGVQKPSPAYNLPSQAKRSNGMTPTVECEKPALPTLWLDTSVVIKLTKIKKGEALQEIEVERGTRLRDLIFHLVHELKLLCPQSDQEEEYTAERLDKNVHGMFAQLSLGISLTHRQGILDEQIFKGMEAYIKKSDKILLPASSYFHEDPVAQLKEAIERKFVITVGPAKPPELLDRRAKAKKEISETWEGLRKEYVAKGQTYEKQLELEVQGHWDGLVELLRKFEASLRSGQYDFWGFMGATGALLYRSVWTDLGGKPEGWEGVDKFFRSACFAELPIPFISSRLGAELLTGNEPIASGDPMDVNLISVALPIAHYVVTDRRMELRIKKLKLDAKFGVHVHSMSSIDELFAELEKLK
jgi:hypothetical protein